MKRRRNLFPVALVCLCLAVAAPAFAVENASLTVYNSGRALVSETRSVQLPDGLASVVFKDVPATLDPTSVKAAASGMTLLGQQYSFLPITERTLLDRFVGEKLSVVLPNPSGEGRLLREATLLSNEGKPVFLLGEEVYVGDYDAVLLPALPEGLQQEPTLTLTADNQGAARRDIRLRYLMGGFNWRADYSLTLNKAGTAGRLDGVATVTNASGAAFNGAQLRLVAGDVSREHSPRRLTAKATMAMDAESAPAQEPSHESFSQYHLYTIERSVDLPPAGSAQFALLQAENLAVRQELLSVHHGSGGQRRGSFPQPVTAQLHFDNTEEGGLGRPMPAGLVRVFMPADDDQELLAGESRIGHVGPGGKATLSLGRSFDVTVQRTQTDFRKLGKNSVEASWRIDVVNGGQDVQSVKLVERFPGQWSIVGASAPYETPDAGSIEFLLSAPPAPDGKPLSVTYTVQITY